MTDAPAAASTSARQKRLRTRLLAYFPRRVPGRQGGANPVSASDIGWEYVPSVAAAWATARSAATAPLQSPGQPHRPRGVHQSLRRPGAPGDRGRTLGRDDLAATGLSGAKSGRGARPDDLLGLRVRGRDARGLRGTGRPVRARPGGQHACGTSSGSARAVRRLRLRVGVPTKGRDRRRLPGRAHHPGDRRDAGGGDESSRFEVAALAGISSSSNGCSPRRGRARTAVDLLTFIYRDPGDYGDDRVYLVRQGLVRATAPNPTTPHRRGQHPRGGRRRDPPRRRCRPDGVDEILQCHGFITGPPPLAALPTRELEQHQASRTPHPARRSSTSDGRSVLSRGRSNTGPGRIS